MVEISKQKEEFQKGLLLRSFENSENQLRYALKKRKSEVKVQSIHISEKKDIVNDANKTNLISGCVQNYFCNKCISV